MAKILNEDERAFYAEASGGGKTKIAKAGLSKAKQDEYRAQIEASPQTDDGGAFRDKIRNSMLQSTMTPQQTIDAYNAEQTAAAPSVSIPITKGDGSSSRSFEAKTPEAAFAALGLPVNPGTTSTQPIALNAPPKTATLTAAPRPPMSWRPNQPPSAPQQRGMSAPRVPGPNKEAFGEYKQGMSEAGQQRLDAINEQGQLAIEQGRMESTLLAEQSVADADLEAKRQAMQVDYQNARQAQMEKLQTLTDKYASAEIDPQKYWNSRNTGQKVLAGIGMFLSGIGSGLAGGPNQAIGVINNAIDRDIDAQKENLAKAGGAVAKQQSLLSVMRDQFGDDAAAMAGTRLSMRQNALDQINVLKTRAAGPEKKAQLDQLAAELAQANLKDAQTFGMQVDAQAANAAAENGKLRLDAQRNQIMMAGKAGGQEKPTATQAGLSALDEIEAKFEKVGMGAYFGAKYIPGTAADDLDQSTQANIMALAASLTPGGKAPRNVEEAIKRVKAAGMPTGTTTKGEGKSDFATIRRAIQRNAGLPSGANEGMDGE